MSLKSEILAWRTRLLLNRREGDTPQFRDWVHANFTAWDMWRIDQALAEAAGQQYTPPPEASPMYRIQCQAVLEAVLTGTPFSYVAHRPTH